LYAILATPSDPEYVRVVLLKAVAAASIFRVEVT